MSAGLDAAREALAGTPAWLVGGAVRDRLLARATADVDVVVDGEPGAAARAIAQRTRAAAFALSEEFGAWRVVARDRSWQVDVERLRADTIEADLALRDFTVNAIAEPLAGGPPIDPLDGIGDLRTRTLRVAGPRAFADDPLRVLRLVRVAVELELEAERETLNLARQQAGALAAVSPERVFMELRRTLAADGAPRGLALMHQLGATAVVLPELEELRGVEQNRFHHLDVHGHTLEVLERTIEMTRAPAPPAAPVDASPLAPSPPSPPVPAPSSALRTLAPELSDALAAVLAEPLADELTRGQALRWGALLHDIAKPLTRDVRACDGRVTFYAHDVRGAEMARAMLARLRASERLRAHVSALVRHHLRLGYLVHERQPLARRTVFAYLSGCAPVEVDVTLLSVADRLATRGERTDEAIQAHVALARRMLADALSWRADGPPAPLVRGDELARELGIAPGPRLGELVGELAAAQYAGEVRNREDALAHARRQL